MKLAEALQTRAALNAKITNLRERLQRSAVGTEGDAPPEAVSDLLVQLDAAISALTVLVFQINYTNMNSQLGDYTTITYALAKRDALKTKHGVLTFLLSHTHNAMSMHRSRASELRAVSHVSIADVQREIDAIGAELRRLDNSIQEANWTVDIIE